MMPKCAYYGCKGNATHSVQSQCDDKESGDSYTITY